jgi:hypothetical protein
VPGPPVFGLKEEMVGVELAAPPIEKPADTLKNTFATASTFTRDVGLGVPGIVTISEPSFGVSLVKTIG